MKTTKILTGITPSGTPHLGNYFGAIRPAIEMSKRDDAQCFYFLSDYHALIKCKDPERIHRSSKEIIASWLALGLNPDDVVLYRQSDIHETMELAWIFDCVTPKGLMNLGPCLQGRRGQEHAGKACGSGQGRQRRGCSATPS